MTNEDGDVEMLLDELNAKLKSSTQDRSAEVKEPAGSRDLDAILISDLYSGGFRDANISADATISGGPVSIGPTFCGTCAQTACCASTDLREPAALVNLSS